jgi:hypothetical protein
MVSRNPEIKKIGKIGKNRDGYGRIMSAQPGSRRPESGEKTTLIADDPAAIASVPFQSPGMVVFLFVFLFVFGLAGG